MHGHGAHGGVLSVVHVRDRDEREGDVIHRRRGYGWRWNDRGERYGAGGAIAQGHSQGRGAVLSQGQKVLRTGGDQPVREWTRVGRVRVRARSSRTGGDESLRGKDWRERRAG